MFCRFFFNCSKELWKFYAATRNRTRFLWFLPTIIFDETFTFRLKWIFRIFDLRRFRLRFKFFISFFPTEFQFLTIVEVKLYVLDLSMFWPWEVGILMVDRSHSWNIDILEYKNIIFAILITGKYNVPKIWPEIVRAKTRGGQKSGY